MRRPTSRVAVVLAVVLIAALAVGTVVYIRATALRPPVVDPHESLVFKEISTGWKPPALKLPPEPTAPDGKPVLLEPGTAFKNYAIRLTDMAHRAMPLSDKVSVFGRVETRQGNLLRVIQDPVSDLGGDKSTFALLSWPTIGGPNQVLTAQLGPTTKVATSTGDLKPLKPGASVVVGGTRVGNQIRAEMVADRDAFKIGAKLTSGNPSTSSAQLVSSVLPLATSLSATRATSTPVEDTDTVSLGMNGRPLGFGGFNPYAEYTTAQDCPYIHIKVELALDWHAEAHFPFQFERLGDSFTVHALQRPDKEDYRPFINFGTAKSEDYSYYSGVGGGLILRLGAGCKVGGFNTEWDSHDTGVALGFFNETYDPAPLLGSHDLTVPGTACPEKSIAFWKFAIAAGLCLQINLSQASLRTTLSSDGGSPQQLTVGYGGAYQVDQRTLRGGSGDTPVSIDNISFASKIGFGLHFGLGIGPSAERLSHTEANEVKQLLRPKDAHWPFTSAERRPNQRGPTLGDGRWRDSYGSWHHEDGSPAVATDLDVTRANAHWVHEGQVGPTLMNGLWQDGQGLWHSATSGAVPLPRDQWPTPKEVKQLAVADTATAANDGAGGSKPWPVRVFGAALDRALQLADLTRTINSEPEKCTPWIDCAGNLLLSPDPSSLKMALGRSPKPALPTLSWNRQPNGRLIPGVHGPSSLVYDPATKQLLYVAAAAIGELAGQPQRSALETWRWDGSRWTLLPLAYAPQSEIMDPVFDGKSNELLTLGLFNERLTTVMWNGSDWHELSGPTPIARTQAGVAYDVANSTVVLFGGRRDDIGPMNDTWIWDGHGWTQAHPNTSPPPNVASGLLTYDPKSRGMLYLDPGSQTTWVWDGQNWSQKSTSASPPSATGIGYLGYSLVTAGNDVVAMGTDSNGGWQQWLWDGNTWHQLQGTAVSGRTSGNVSYIAPDDTFVTLVWDAQRPDDLETYTTKP